MNTLIQTFCVPIPFVRNPDTNYGNPAPQLKHESSHIGTAKKILYPHSYPCTALSNWDKTPQFLASPWGGQEYTVYPMPQLLLGLFRKLASR